MKFLLQKSNAERHFEISDCKTKVEIPRRMRLLGGDANADRGGDPHDEQIDLIDLLSCIC